ncbi:hypothetical protein KP509_05G057600 [Ceratopteris richardii]|uniref:Pentatricopeptide repeat-containing protein n=1 Tax=Ceratopteris richardii TaxID=49495 RepID=A0A8T2UYK1_CERRI|nr:hypothetical protein KP509_05G057600 [Ceratopteris richardii]
MLVCALVACCVVTDLELGREIHALSLKLGMFEKDPLVGSSLVSLYAKYGLIKEARKVLMTIPIRDLISWTAFLQGCTDYGHYEEALHCFEWMQQENVAPNSVAFVCALSACSDAGAIAMGSSIHREVILLGLETTLTVANAMVDMYAKCGMLENAQKTFDELAVQNVVSWTALISGYAQNGSGDKALYCFEQMRRDGLSPNESTFSCILKACGAVGDIWKGCEVHVEIMKAALLERDIVIANALVDMYAKCGDMVKAPTVFNELPVPDVVSRSTLISGYAQHLHYEQALCCFECMKLGGVSPNTITCVSILSACGRLGAFSKGQENYRLILNAYCHASLVSEGHTHFEAMYAGCGLLIEAREVLFKLRYRRHISWSSLMSGYIDNRLGKEALEFFNQSQSEGCLATLSCLFVP